MSGDIATQSSNLEIFF